MSGISLKIIVAACTDGGIGKNGELPWRLKKELSYFAKKTTDVIGEGKLNAVIMGHNTWKSIPEGKRPLAKRINIVLSRTVKYLGPHTFVCSSFEEAISLLNQPPLIHVTESAWVIGGSSVYAEALQHDLCHEIYLTEIKKSLDCDTFLPEIPKTFCLVDDPGLPKELQEENGIKYEYKLYKKVKDLYKPQDTCN